MLFWRACAESALNALVSFSVTLPNKAILASVAFSVSSSLVSSSALSSCTLSSPVLSRPLTIHGDELRVQCYMHASDYAPQGWYAKAERNLKLNKRFHR